MKRKLILTVLMIILTVMMVQAQANQPRRGGQINGDILDNSTNNPIEYANIILFSQQDNSQITGTITDKDGHFELTGIRPGRYYIEIRFMGFKIERLDNILLAPPQMAVDLGKVSLQPTVLSMETVAVEGEKPALTYEIDKKVIAVSQVQTAISGNAADVLENVPSVTVDIEGNVSLRGSENFQVLIDGRPTVLEPNDALQQIPASTIENIEIITNPSAKYDPDGTAGIINLVMKKNKRNGRSGLVNLNGGLKDKYGGDILLENRSRNFSVVLGVDYRHRSFSGTDKEKSWTRAGDETYYINSDGDAERGGVRYGIRTAVDWYITQKDVLGIEGRYGYRSHHHDSEQNYDEWSEPDLLHSFYLSSNFHKRSGNFYSANFNYRHQFAKKGHELSALIRFSERDGTEKARNELFTLDETITSGRRSTEEGPSRDFRTKVDYTLPLNEDDKFEAGYQSEYDRSDEVTGLSDYMTDENTYQFVPEFAHTTEYNRDTHSLYAIYSANVNKIGLQGGFRGEYTYRTTEILGVTGKNKINRWDYFPTAHLSYEFSKGRQFMASYTRRIDRPRGYYLEPFETWMDAFNVRKGNPAIKPEYIDSYETGFQTSFGRNLFSTEFYYRKTNNKVERVRSVYDVNVTLHTVENVGTDYAMGTELLLNLDLTKFWNINLMGNIYKYRVEGTLYGDSFSRESNNWNSRFNNVFKITKSTQLQINSGYRSATVSSQGRREGFFITDFAVKQEFFDRALSVSLQVRDIFQQRKYEFTSEGPDFYMYNHFSIEAPIVMLNIRYNINNYKMQRNQRGQRGQVNGMGEDDEF